MKHRVEYLKRMLAKAIVGLAACLFAGAVSLAADINERKDVEWRAYHDLSDSAFSSRFNSLREQGFRMIDIDVSKTIEGLRYSQIWEDNETSLGWAEYRNMTSDQYHARWREQRDRGRLPIDIETYKSGDQRLWAGIWEENRSNVQWSSHRNLTGDQYGDLFRTRQSEGYRLIDLEVYNTSGGLRYACIWMKNTDGRGWAGYRNMTRDQYQTRVNDLASDGLSVVDFESYDTSSGVRYAAVWSASPNRRIAVRSHRRKEDFEDYARQYADEGMRLIDYERIRMRGRTLHSGIWAANDRRSRYGKHNALSRIITDFQTANGVPGISVAIMDGGELVYSRGFGDQESDNDQKPHAGSVYGLASVSKVVGGTLAARLEERGRTARGRSVDLDMDRQTAEYLADISVNGATRSLPTQHVHSVAQLIAHQGCVPHYTSRTTPGHGNPTSHFSTAVAALPQVWNLGLVTDRNVGAAGNQPCLDSDGALSGTKSYSTGAFTIFGAVLERVTGRAIDDLVEEEIARPFGLNSLMTQYATSSMRSNDNRVVPYRGGTTNSPRKTSYGNTSWKVLGGGLEANAVDVARFGHMTMSGRILSPDTFERKIMTPVSGRGVNGYAWESGSYGGRRMAEHGGSGTGAGTHLRIFPDDGLAIAVLMNRNRVSPGVGTLANLIADELLRGRPTAAAGSARPARANADFSGTWQSRYGTLNLVQRGDHVVGDYAGRGIIVGTVRGQCLSAHFTNTDAVGYVRLTKDGISSFTGQWRWASRNNLDDWTGSRTGPAASTMNNFLTGNGTSSYVSSQARDFEGVYVSGSDRVEMKAEDGVLLGDYIGRGFIAGVWNGNGYEGYIQDGNKIERFRLTVQPGSDAITGGVTLSFDETSRGFFQPRLRSRLPVVLHELQADALACP